MIGYDLNDLEFENVKHIFPKITDGNYGSSVAFPEPSDSMVMIGNEDSLERWKVDIKSRYGNVEIRFYPHATAWFDKVKVHDSKFIQDKEDYTNAKGRWLDKERKAGKSSGLD